MCPPPRPDPLAVVATIALLPAALTLIARLGFRRVQVLEPVDHCTACNYSLAGLDLPRPCPECGLECSHNMPRSRRAEVDPLGLLRLLFVFGFSLAACFAVWYGACIGVAVRQLLILGWAFEAGWHKSVEQFSAGPPVLFIAYALFVPILLSPVIRRQSPAALAAHCSFIVLGVFFTALWPPLLIAGAAVSGTSLALRLRRQRARREVSMGVRPITPPATS